MFSFITCSYFFGMEIQQTADGASGAEFAVSRDQTDHKSSTYITTVQTGSQLMKWNANTQFVYANAEQSRRAGREARLHVRLQISNSELWCQTNCMCAWLCVWLCVIDSPVLNPHCCICCSLFCLLHFIMNCCTQLVCDTLWKLPGPFYHECCVIIKRWNAALCIQPKVHHVMIRSQRCFCFLRKLVLSFFSFPSDWFCNVFSASLPSSPNHSWTLLPHCVLFCCQLNINLIHSNFILLPSKTFLLSQLPSIFSIILSVLICLYSPPRTLLPSFCHSP